MIPALTVGTAIAFIIGIIGLMFLINGIRYTFPDEVLIGIICLLATWWILT